MKSFLTKFPLLILMLLLAAGFVFYSAWLYPSVFDLKLELAAFIPDLAKSFPEGVLEVHPQLSIIPFWLSGALDSNLGMWGGTGLRYFLFFLTLALFAKAYRTRWPGSDWIIFCLVIGTSFFFHIKFFLWLDYLFVLPLTLLLASLLQKGTKPFIVFILTALVLHLKISSVFILVVVLLTFVEKEKLEKQKWILTSAVIMMMAVFFLTTGMGVLDDRLSFGIKDGTVFLHAFNLLAKPWLFFKILDISEQRFLTTPDFLLLLKAVLFVVMAVFLFLRNKIQTSLRIGAIAFGLLFTCLMVRKQPAIHDISAYLGVVGIGFFGLIWDLSSETRGKQRNVVIGVLAALFIIDGYYWVSSLIEMDVRETKFTFIREMKGSSQKSIHFFCPENVGEFDFYLKDKKIQYSIRGNLKNNEAYQHSLLLIPDHCLHEEISESQKQSLEKLLVGVSGKFIRQVKFDKDQDYRLYEVP